VGVLGLSFKANTDDVRFSPAVELIKRLLAEGAVVTAYDPQAMDKLRVELPALRLASDPYEVAAGAEALILATEWALFQALEWDKIFPSMLRPLVFDTRNMLDPEQMMAIGFEYYSVGRGQRANRLAAS
jgi:UDPglucose 6-dehydrogenase